MQWKIDGRSLVAAALLVGGALLMPPAGTATAQAPGSVVDDIVGLRVGMSYDAVVALLEGRDDTRSEEHTSELQSLMRISYAVFCLQKKKRTNQNSYNTM